MPGIEISTSASWSLILLFILFCGGVVAIYWWFVQTVPSRTRTWVLGLRTALLIVVGLLLIGPEISWIRPVVMPPKIGIYLDNSLSMANHPSASATTISSQVERVINWAEEANYEPVVMTFGEELIFLGAEKLEYHPDERITDFNLLEETWQTGDMQAGFLFSDGVATAGVDPSAMRGVPKLPIHTVGIGDTSSGIDLTILDLKYPLSIMDQERGEIEVTIRGRNVEGRQSQIFLFHEDQPVYSRPIFFESREHIETFKFDIVGRMDAPNFHVQLMVLEEEANIENNRRELQVDVLPGRRTMTMITGALSPNTTLANEVTRGVSMTDASHLYALRGAWHGDEATFWATPQNLIILNNYPTPDTPQDHIARLLGKINSDNAAVLVIEGPDSRTNSFSGLVRNLGFRIFATVATATSEEYLSIKEQTGLPALQYVGASGLRGEDVPPTSLSHVLPPNSNSRLQPIMTNSSGSIVTGYGYINGRKRAIILLPALASLNLKMHTTPWFDYLGKMTSALVEWSLEPEGFTPYVVRPDRKQYHLGEKVGLRALTRERSGIKMIAPVLTLEVEGPGSVAMVTMNYNYEDEIYEGEYWPSESGIHRYRVYTESMIGDEPFSRGFQVQPGRVELESLVQNRYSLQRLSESTGGTYVGLLNVESLLSELRYDSRIVTRESVYSIWRLKYLWVFILALMVAEWVIRRRIGLI